MLRESEEGKLNLNRVVGLATSVLLVAGLMIGSGVFKKIAPMSRSLGSESWILLAWIVAGLVTLFGAFTYSGLAALTTRTGGVYEYLQTAFGDFVAFLFGWSFFTITGSGAIAALSVIFSQSVDTLIHFPSPFFAGSGIKLFAIVVIALLTWLNTRGIQQGSRLNNIVTAAKIGGILLLIVSSLLFPRSAAGLPQQNSIVTNGGPALFSAFFGAMLSALWAYDGWSNITFITGEIKNPQRNLPYAIVGGVSIAMFLYVMLNYGFMRVLPMDQLAAIGENKIAAAEAAHVVMGGAGSLIIAVLIMTCTFGATNASILVYPRLYLRMAQENRFFKKAAAIHPVFKTPHTALLYSGIWSCILVISGTFDLLTNLVVLASYGFFGLAAWGLIKLKRKKVLTTRVIGYPFTPILVILFSLTLIINSIITDPMQSLTGLLLILSGVPFLIYFKKQEKKAGRT